VRTFRTAPSLERKTPYNRVQEGRIMMTISLAAARVVRRTYVCLAALDSVTLSASVALAVYGPQVIVGDVYQQTSTTQSSDARS
jgi:hypothetical protein